VSKTKGLLNKYSRTFLWIIVFAAVVYLVVRNISVFGNILLVMLGFGAVVLVHEFGHFIFAKLTGIKVETFSIFVPPILVGVRRTADGFRFRILPKFFPKEDDAEGDGLLSFTIGRKGKAGEPRPLEMGEGETEYRIGLIPFGGYVKMLGQEDVGSAEARDDPRSFANKPIGARMAVIAAGVTFNAISAILIFMIVFLIGINLPPAVVGGVIPGSPAERAGLKPGDEVIEIAGRRGNLDFSSIGVAAALSDRGEEVTLKVKHADGSIEDFAIVAEQRPGMPMKVFGILAPQSLTVAKVSDANALFENIGLLPGDRVKSVNGKDVQNHWELAEIVRDALVPEVAILAERTEGAEKGELIESEIGLGLSFADSYEIKSESELHHIYSMVPRLRITIISEDYASRAGGSELSLQRGDIIVAIGDVENPTYKEMRDVTTEYEQKELPIKILRADANGVENRLTVTVVPKRSQDNERVVIGIGVAFDAERPVVAKTISVEDGPARLAIPRGAVITAVDGVGVSNFYDVIAIIGRNAGRRVTIDYRVDEETAGAVALDVGDAKGFVTVKSTLTDFVPFERLEKLYKAKGPIDAIGMGYEKTVMFIAQTYMTLKRLIGGLVSPKNLMGPIGIITFSYRVVSEQPLVYYIYFLGLISACIAVFNFLPLPPLDGGHIVFLLVEKIKGSALSERIQGTIAYAGWVLVGVFVLYVTFNDIVRSFF
jgi:regulator of sigma E protease